MNKKLNLVGSFIKTKRKALKMSQKKLGSILNPPVTTQFISNIERGITPLPLPHIEILSKTLLATEEEIMVLLEKEYTQKLNYRLRQGKDSLIETNPILPVSHSDYDFMKNLYHAYCCSDESKRTTFTTLCKGLFKMNLKEGNESRYS